MTVKSKRTFEDKNMYNEILDLKDEGKLFPFDEISYEQLKALWWDETLSDSIIGRMFEVDKKVVTNKRNVFGITQNEMLAQSQNNKFLMFVEYLQYQIKNKIENKEEGISAIEIIDEQFEQMKQSIQKLL